VAVSFWSMVAVFLSGIIGRFIYLQIPRTIEGRELSLNEVRQMKNEITALINNDTNINEGILKAISVSEKRKFEYIDNLLFRYIKNYLNDRQSVRSAKSALKKSGLPEAGCKKIISLLREDLRLTRKIESLASMQNLFRHWHVVHLPFALVMFIIMIIHVAVTIVFGYRWIF